MHSESSLGGLSPKVTGIFFFFGMLQFYLEASVSLNVCDITGIQNKFTDTNVDIVGAFVAKAPLSH